MYTTIIVLLSIPLSILGMIGFRGAGGLFSQWAGRDLGNFLPRQAWGFSAILPMIGAVVIQDISWYYKVLCIVASGVLTGMLRGAGWGNSLALGYSSVKGKPDNTHTRKCIRMFLSLFQMLCLPGIVLFGVVSASEGHISAHHLNMLAEYCVAVPFLVVCCYNFAWKNGGFDIPILGCLTQDPPPTGELFAGYVSSLALSILSFGIVIGK